MVQMTVELEQAIRERIAFHARAERDVPALAEAAAIATLRWVLERAGLPPDAPGQSRDRPFGRNGH